MPPTAVVRDMRLVCVFSFNFSILFIYSSRALLLLILDTSFLHFVGRTNRNQGALTADALCDEQNKNKQIKNI